MHNSRFALTTLLVFALLLVLPACGGGTGGAAVPADPTDPVGTGGMLRISVTDAPFPSAFVESATVVIKEVRVHESGGDAWQTVFVGSRTIDLVPLTGGVAELLVEVPLDPGAYNEVRLIVDAGTVTLTADAVVKDDEVFTVADGDLKFPSGSQTGIKIKIDNDIVVTTELSGDLVLDFDLSKSFVFNGPFTHQPGVQRVIFKPVVRATNSSTNGTLALDVASDKATPQDTADDFPLVGATVRVFDSADVQIAMGLTDDTGHFQTTIVPDTYRVTVEADGHDAAEELGVMVALANLTDLGTITLVASETEITGVVLSDGATSGDTSDDANVAGALVEAVVSGDTTVVASATTDANGAFVLAMLASEDYDLTVSIQGWTTQVLTSVTSVFPGTGGGVTVTLVALTRDLDGTVTDNADAAMSGVTVTVKNANGTVIATSAPTAADGIYALPGIPSGEHTIEAFDGTTTTTPASITVVGASPATAQTEDIKFP